MAEGGGVGCFGRATAACCCVRVMARDEALEAMLGPTTEPSGPSLFSRLCWCQCSPVARQPPNLEAFPDLNTVVSGVSLQKGEHITAGSLQTMRAGRWDAATRTVTTDVFGGFWMRENTGTWTEPAGSILWYSLMFLARAASYRYDVVFSEDLQSADIWIKCNPLFCVPCLPPCCTVPRCISKQTMVQSDDSIKGDHWLRMSGSFGKEPTFFYDLFVVYDSSGTPTRFADQVPASAPAQVQISF